MRVTLTFDNGPDPEVTPRVLEILARRGITAQFYVLGKWLTDPARRRCVVEARDAGHLIGNHSFSHDVPLGEDPRPDAVAREIAATEALLAPLVPGPRRFRPFGGGGAIGPHLLSRAAVDYLIAHSYTCVLWNSVPRDWADPDGWVARALADCTDDASHTGDPAVTAPTHTVIVLHDLPGASLAGLDDFLGTLLDRGAELTAELPESCTPIVDGHVVTTLDGLVAPDS
ncbi:MAG TPA: polysaccharide deacetylase family protein [Kofleriaceae bacterium]|nr:polysaccharide deacetylase family protein [Kofleriaceae bacterium]